MYYDNLYGNFYIVSCALIYIILLAFVFFSRKKLNTTENKLYSALIALNLIGDALLVICVYYLLYDPLNILLKICEKLYLFYVNGIMLTFTVYFIVLAYGGDSSKKKDEVYKVAKKWSLLIFVVICFLVLVLKTYFRLTDRLLFESGGPGLLLTYGFAFLAVMVWIWVVIKKRKELPLGKKLSILGVVFAASASGSLEFLTHANLLIIDIAEAFCIYILYLTIFLVDNPDMKMVEEIKNARNEAESSNVSTSEFLSYISREIRTPLNTIIGFSDSLLEEDLDGDPHEDVVDISNASNSLLSIINGISDISKIESNELVLTEEEYSFEDVYRYLINMTKVRLGRKQIEFIHECSNNVPKFLYGDSDRIKRLVLNILTNAVKYTHNGYIKLNIDCTNIDDDRCRFNIVIEDSGVGIKKEDLDRLFNKYERLDEESNNNIEGTGLGLAISKKYIDLLNGTINVESNYGEGSKFTITFEQKISNNTSLEELEEIEVL
ncbi:MAG: HAMP domain-containing sensor histidine kinase [Bacilli bacterium]|nr:HAMP domain-containing sensor histidine kinase [Bacilli bacterium]